jgi:hypothetical protein
VRSTFQMGAPAGRSDGSEEYTIDASGGGVGGGNDGDDDSLQRGTAA